MEITGKDIFIQFNKEGKKVAKCHFFVVYYRCFYSYKILHLFTIFFILFDSMPVNKYNYIRDIILLLYNNKIFILIEYNYIGKLI